MSNVQILDYNKFDFTRLQYFDPLKSVSNGKSKYISEQGYKSLDGKSNTIYVQTPKLNVVKNNVDDKWIEVSLDPETDVAFYNFIIRVEETNMIATYRNSREWFGKQHTREDIDKAYNTNLIQKRGKLPSIKFNLQVMRNQLITDIYNEKNVVINQNNIEVGDSIIGIVQFDGLRFLADTISWDISLSQVKVYGKPLVKPKLIGCVIDDSDLKPTFIPKDKQEPNYESEQDLKEQESIHQGMDDLDLTIDLDDVNDVYETNETNETNENNSDTGDVNNNDLEDEYEFDIDIADNSMKPIGNNKQHIVEEINAFKQAITEHEMSLNKKKAELMSDEEKMIQMRNEYLEYCHRYNLTPN